MREILTFPCEGFRLGGTVDTADKATGLLIVSGGNEIRIGAHRGMARLAQVIAAKGVPVFRFDRRGIGDSEGDNHGFQSSGPDIAAALVAFRAACPQLDHVVAFGNCDAATALVIHDPAVDGLVLANPWIIEPTDDLPPAAAIRDRYARRLRDPKAYLALLTGKLNIRAARDGLRKITSPAPTQPLANTMAQKLAHQPGTPTTILLAKGDNTAIAFAHAWSSDLFKEARQRSDVTVITLDSTSHSFAGEADFEILVQTVERALQSFSGAVPARS